MTCRDAIGFLMDYLSGDLPTEVRRAFDVHLARCPNCGVFLAQYEQTVRAGKRVCAEAEADAGTGLPEELLKAIMGAIGRNP